MKTNRFLIIISILAVVTAFSFFRWFHQNPNVDRHQSNHSSDNDQHLIDSRSSGHKKSEKDQDPNVMLGDTTTLGHASNSSDQNSQAQTFEEKIRNRINENRKTFSNLNSLETRELVQLILKKKAGYNDDVTPMCIDMLVNRTLGGEYAIFPIIEENFGSLDRFQQDLVIELLGRIPRKESLAMLYAILEKSDFYNRDPYLQDNLLIAIADLGAKLPYYSEDDAGFVDIYSYYIETYPYHLKVVSASAIGICNLGNESGVSYLLGVLKKEQIESDSAKIIVKAFEHIDSPDVSSLLENQLFNDSEIYSPATLASGWGIVGIDEPESSEILVKYAANASEPHQKEAVVEWISKLQNRPTLDLILNSEQVYQFNDLELLAQLKDIAIKKTQSYNDEDDYPARPTS